MVIISIKKKLFLTIVIAALLCSVGLNVYHYSENTRLERNYEALICTANEFEITKLIPFMAAVDDSIKNRQIEIFDVIKGQVIEKTESSKDIQKEVERLIERITGMYIKVKAFPEKGYIIKVPMDPPLKVKNKWLNDYGINSVNKVFILFPGDEAPYLLVLDNNGRPLFYNFEGSTEELLDELDFDPEVV